MPDLVESLRQQWRTSRSFRWWTALAFVGLAINLILTALWQLEILAVEDTPPVNDLKLYLDAGRRFLQREDLYIMPRSDFGLFSYSPVFALVMGILTFVPYKLIWVVDAFLHIILYGALYCRWVMIFRQQRLDSAAESLIRLFPLWLIFTGLPYEIAYMNIYIFMAFLATLLLEEMLYRKPAKAILWLNVLLLVKPQWAFALGIPFLLGEWRFLARVIGGALLIYFAVLALMMLFTGQYALEQYWEYVQFLQSIPHTFVWNTMTEEGHIGYNNSLMQLIIFFTNNAPYSISMTTAIKILLSLPLIVIFQRYRRSASNEATAALLLEWSFALYLLAFLWLDVVTELTFAIVVFSYLQGMLPQRSIKNWARLLFLPYALTFMWVTISSIISFFTSLPNILLDPSIFIPFILITALGLYILLVRQLGYRLRSHVAGSAV